MNSIIGTKIGMTRIFDKIGNMIPVTVVSVKPNVITAVRTKEKDGYTAVRLGYGEIDEKKVNRPDMGFFKKNNLPVKKYQLEFRTADISGLQTGQEVKLDIFKAGEYVDVAGTSKGKGFAGTVKRHGFAGGVITHGQSDRQRSPGSIGSQGFQRVIKGLRMAGHLGHEKVTIQHLEIAEVDPEKSVILIKGAVPGVNNDIVVISKTVKRVKVKREAAPAKKEKKGAAKSAKK
ncbi:MAG: 50S ribosomal protein L3 [Endomicrobiales bacterium]|nr:50S ribosomal protein L3 [Endomicrobiales bacterium]